MGTRTDARGGTGFGLALCAAPLAFALGSTPVSAAPDACSSPGRFRDPVRSALVRGALARAGVAVESLDAPNGAALCFGTDIESGLLPDGSLQIDVQLSPLHAAARVAHLLHHGRPGSPLAGELPHADCARWLEAALAEEAAGYALELAVLERLGTASALPFADAVRAAPGRAEAVILAWLDAHPEGGDGVPALGSNYRARCALGPGER